MKILELKYPRNIFIYVPPVYSCVTSPAKPPSGPVFLYHTPILQRLPIATLGNVQKVVPFNTIPLPVAFFCIIPSGDSGGSLPGSLSPNVALLPLLDSSFQFPLPL